MLVGDAGNDAGFGGTGSDFCDTESRDSCESSQSERCPVGHP
ncbi:MAG: hypothetical protein ACRDT0_13070 [Pseudonocardiaceae bacterium]